MEIWDLTRNGGNEHRAIYVAISGNTAAGKTSLIEGSTERLSERGLPAVGIGERVFHHPLLPLMFREPERYAFPLQLTFMLGRHLLLLRHLSLGHIVVMERSHLEDELFLREHYAEGRIAEDQLTSYTKLAESLHSRLRMPDVLVLMNPSVATSIARLDRAERTGARPREFPDNAARDGWIVRWHAAYERLHEDFRRKAANDPEFQGVELLDLDPDAPSSDSASLLVQAILPALSRISADAGGE